MVFLKLYVAAGVVMTLVLVAEVILVILTLKAFFARERPSHLGFTSRLVNMREREHGKSMPSGDTLASAFFCMFFYLLFGAHPLIFLQVPLTALGRVYCHCHWLGDTVVGAALGIPLTYFILCDPWFGTFAKPIFLIIFKILG